MKTWERGRAEGFGSDGSVMNVNLSLKVGMIQTLNLRLILSVIISVIAMPELVLAIDPNPPGDLAVSVFMAESPDFIQEWVNTPSSFGPTIHRIKKARFNQQVHAGFIVTGYTRQENFQVNFVVNVKITDPTGKVILDQKSWARLSNEMSKERSFILADPVLDLMIETGDPAGKYRIEATVLDLVAGKTASGSWELDVEH
jgi:hypothetical protein